MQVYLAGFLARTPALTCITTDEDDDDAIAGITYYALYYPGDGPKTWVRVHNIIICAHVCVSLFPGKKKDREI